MDKPLENLIGYITVLPGAFSAYRWSVIGQDEILWEFYLNFLFKSLNPEDTVSSKEARKQQQSDSEPITDRANQESRLVSPNEEDDEVEEEEKRLIKKRR
jgi:hypothetical protein